MLAREIIGDIITSHIKESHYSQKEVSLLSGISESKLSKIINGESEISFISSQKLSQVFDDLKDDEDFLFKTYKKLLFLEKSDNEDLKLLNTFDKFALMDDFSKINILRKNIDGGSFKKFERFILNSSTSFSRYKDDPKGKLWLVLMYKKYKNQANTNSFKKSTKNTVYKKVFEIFFQTNLSIEKRIEAIQAELWKRGLIVKNGPYFKGSLIKGVSFVRKTNRFIFLTDMYKREFRWLISLVHELVHFYENFTNEQVIENYSINIIKDYIAKNNIKHSDFAAFFEIYNQFYDLKKRKFLISKDEYFNKIHDATKHKIIFGHEDDLIDSLIV